MGSNPQYCFVVPVSSMGMDWCEIEIRYQGLFLSWGGTVIRILFGIYKVFTKAVSLPFVALIAAYHLHSNRISSHTEGGLFFAKK